mmetsp:Transcript_24510/g.56489  ORF Transcript_24510/g.56489 Transcript_24510/m.56489 type:complete len:679 (+) Transcript_24510:30-2066(+)
MAHEMPRESDYAMVPTDSRLDMSRRSSQVSETSSVFTDDVGHPVAKPQSRRGINNPPCVILSLVGGLYLIWVILVLVAMPVGMEFGARRVTWQEDMFSADGNIWTPANLSRLYRRRVPSCHGFELLSAFEAYGAAHNASKVGFPSRQGPDGQQSVRLTAWWLPADDPVAPRVVVVHPGHGNFNSPSVQLVSYFLRSLGFGVLAVNLRDHGTSEASAHEGPGWGFDYPFDVLGAWDYAVLDPDKKLGGATEKVGLLGFSEGAYAAAVAFGLEPRIVGLWVDSMVLDWGQAIRERLAGGPLGLFADIMTPFASYVMQSMAGTSVSLYSPVTVLQELAGKEGIPTRPVAVLHGSLDDTVFKEQSLRFIELMKDPNASRLDAKLVHLVAYDCAGERHAEMHVWQPSAYREMLASFWGTTFHTEVAFDKLQRLPVIPGCFDAVCNDVHIPATRLAALPEHACTSFTDLDMANAKATVLEKDADGRVLTFHRIAYLKDVALDLAVYASSGYTPSQLGASENGKVGPFGSVSLQCGKQVNLTFQFVEAGTSSPISLKGLFFTVLDIDAGSANTEWIFLPGIPRYSVSLDSALLVANNGSASEADTWTTAFRAAPGVVPRPSIASAMSPEAAQHAITFFFQDISEFSVKFVVSDCSGFPEDDGIGGQILFTGITNFTCPSHALTEE